MPYLGDENNFIIRYNDSEIVEDKCEVEKHRFICGHTNIYVFRCKRHDTKPQVDKPGETYCKGPLPFRGGEAAPIADENCPQHNTRAAFKQAAAETKSQQEDPFYQTNDREEEEGEDAVEYSGYP